MNRLSLVGLLLTLIVAPSVGGSQRVAIRVSPVVALEPAFLTIRTTIEPNDDNRQLRITLESDTYSTSSDVPLEGRNSARLNVLELRDVPSGLYEARAVVTGPHGPIAETMQIVEIQPAVGGRRR